MRILGLDTPDELVIQWSKWLAPERQPFLLADDELPGLELDRGPRVADIDAEVEPAVRDTYALWRVDRDLRVIWLDEQAFHELPRDTRAKLVRAQHNHKRGEVPSVRAWRYRVKEAAAQADGHRFVWWPSLLAGREEDVLPFWISDGLPDSRHAEVPFDVWQAAETLLPKARALAGTWPHDSGPNCFGAVLAAAGVEGAEHEWLHGEPFEDFLATRTKPGGDDDKPGTVLVWRDREGLARHAAVTLGGGWAFQKPSQCWYTPRHVLTVAELIKTSRMVGERLSARRHLVA